MIRLMMMVMIIMTEILFLSVNNYNGTCLGSGFAKKV